MGQDYGGFAAVAWGWGAGLVTPAALAVIVDAKDDAAVDFYEHHGFERFVAQDRTLFLQVASAVKTLRSSSSA